MLDGDAIGDVPGRLEATSNLGSKLELGFGRRFGYQTKRLAHQREHFSADDEVLQVHPKDATRGGDVLGSARVCTGTLWRVRVLRSDVVRP